MLVSTKMITGFNTDVPHEGHVYHVQTEDRGKDNPIFESLVYVGGTVVAKKLTPYSDRLSEGATQEGIASLLKRQHQVIIAAIKAGRIEDLIRHSRERYGAGESIKRSSGRLAPPPTDVLPNSHEQVVISDAPVAAYPAARPSEAGRAPVTNSGGAGYRRGDTGGLNLDKVLEDYANRGAGQAKLEVKVLTPEVFTAGKSVSLRVGVADESKPAFDAIVTVKIIGTAFKPQVLIGRVGRDGVASFSLTLPAFSAGTAAIVIEAQSGNGRGELKKLIRRA